MTGINTIKLQEDDDTFVDKFIEENDKIREVLTLKRAIGYKNQSSGLQGGRLQRPVFRRGEFLLTP